MSLSRRLLLVGVVICLGSVSEAAAQSVKPLGVFPFTLPGTAASPQPKALLWCQGANLVGVLVPDTKSVECGAGQKRSAPRALLLRDGRCDAAGVVSFGLLVSRKAWVFDPTIKTPQERTVWQVLRFEGSLKGSQLAGALVQVDVNHPGLPFQKANVEAEALHGDEQASFADEAAWRSGMTQAFCLATSEP